MLFDDLFQATKAAPLALDLEGRSYAPYLAIVTNNADPQGDRRIKVTQPGAPTLETDWIRRLQPSPYIDPPLPPVGSTVLVLSIDGDTTNGWYLQCVNQTNPPLAKADPISDHHQRVPGDQSINVGSTFTLTVDGGASITVGPGNVVTVSASEILVDTTSFMIKGKQIATVGAVDSQGHALVSKGW